jgi:hypothetical protein
MVIISLFFIFFGCTTTENSNTSKEDEKLRFDGIYFYETNGYTNYLRFYQGDNVISLTSIGKYNKTILTNWSIENYSDAIGKYQINNKNIIFTIIFSEGTINYNGIITSNSLRLNSHSTINNHKENDIVYNFKKL